MDHADILELHRLGQAAQNQLEKVEARIRQALGTKGFTREKAWLDDARALLDERIQALAGPLQAAQQLPELEPEREAFARAPQGEWVDALEKLWAGISFHLGRRAPLLEALFPHQKFAVLRKPKLDAVRAYQHDLERRAASTYVQRILADDDAAFAKPVLDDVSARFAAWDATLTAPPLEGKAAEKAREAVRKAARKLEPAMRQARHLFDAASLTLPEPEPDVGEDEA